MWKHLESAGWTTEWGWFTGACLLYIYILVAVFRYGLAAQVLRAFFDLKKPAIPENREIKNGNSVFSVKDMHCPWFRTYLWSPIEWLTFGQNSSTCCYSLRKKLNFHFWFSPIFGLCKKPLCFASSRPGISFKTSSGVQKHKDVKFCSKSCTFHTTIAATLSQQHTVLLTHAEWKIHVLLLVFIAWINLSSANWALHRHWEKSDRFLRKSVPGTGTSRFIQKKKKYQVKFFQIKPVLNLAGR